MNIEYNTMTLLCKDRAGFAWLFHYKDHMKDTSSFGETRKNDKRKSIFLLEFSLFCSSFPIF